MENKQFWESKTFWGIALLGLEAFLIQIGAFTNWTWVHGLLAGLGIILTGYGFRSAITNIAKK